MQLHRGQLVAEYVPALVFGPCVALGRIARGRAHRVFVGRLLQRNTPYDRQRDLHLQVTIGDGKIWHFDRSQVRWEIVGDEVQVEVTGVPEIRTASVGGALCL